MYRLNRNESSPFQSPRANPKHAARQVNGETAPSQLQKIIKVQTRKRT
ncbi:YpzG family protein [Paraliobacillus salinarum]|nr:YpzG family protein [Paraliobacillus salinarum]